MLEKILSSALFKGGGLRIVNNGAHFYRFFYCNNKQLFLFRAPCAGNFFPLIFNVDCCFLASFLYQKLGGDFAYYVPPSFKVGGDMYTMSLPQRRPWAPHVMFSPLPSLMGAS